MCLWFLASVKALWQAKWWYKLILLTFRHKYCELMCVSLSAHGHTYTHKNTWSLLTYLSTDHFCILASLNLSVWFIFSLHYYYYCSRYLYLFGINAWVRQSVATNIERQELTYDTFWMWNQDIAASWLSHQDMLVLEYSNLSLRLLFFNMSGLGIILLKLLKYSIYFCIFLLSLVLFQMTTMYLFIFKFYI